MPTLHEEGKGASATLACGSSASRRKQLANGLERFETQRDGLSAMMASRSRSRRLPVLLARARHQGLAPARQGHGPQQQRLHAARKGGVTGLDGEPTVPELVSEADLPKVDVPSMGRERHARR